MQHRPTAGQLDSDVAGIPPLDGEGPIWVQVRRAIAARILSGDWPPDLQVPPELVLAGHYGTSRMTVNKAIQSLAAEGLVLRRPKTGTVVTARARERSVLEVWDAAQSVQRAGGHYGYRLLDYAKLDAGAATRAMIDVPGGTPLVSLLCLHLSDDRPFQLEERLINVLAAPGITSQPLKSVSPGQWLLAHVPWTRATYGITARGANDHAAGHLALAPGAPCLVIERRTWNGNTAVTFGRFWHPGDGHSLEGEFKPSW